MDDLRYPVFRYVSGSYVPGFGPREIASSLLVMAVAFVLFFLAGIPTATTMEPVGPSERQAQLLHKQELRNQLYSLDVLAGQADASEYESGSPRQVYVDAALAASVRDEAAALGIEASMTDDELMVTVPTEKEVTYNVVPFIWRVILFVLVPLVLVIAWYAEFMQGTTLGRELVRWGRWAHAQRLYPYRSRWSDEYHDPHPAESRTS
jgi:hypothetical protein